MVMSDRIAVMTEGGIAQIGPPTDVYLHPDTPFVANFLGETNMLPVIFEGTDNGRAAVRYANGALGHARLPHDGRAPHAGDRALVSLRPERVRFTGAAEAKMEGRMIAHTFLGRHSRSVVQVLGQTLAVSTTELLALTTGATVHVGWNDEDAQLLNEKTGGNDGGN
jgi:ABC-type Fe3+/spermidine/putrescine transport system ATPase subunit